MFCKNCGKQLKEGSRFCPECGTQVAAISAQSAPKAAPGSGGAAQRAQAPCNTGNARPSFRERAEQRRKANPFNQAGQSFTFAHFLSLICCVIVVVALFLPNRTAPVKIFGHDLGYEKSSTIMSTVLDRCDYAWALMDADRVDTSERSKFVVSTIFTAILAFGLLLDTSYVFTAILRKHDLAAVNGCVGMSISMGLLIWLCGGGLHGTGYVMLLIGSLGALLFSVGGYMINQDLQKRQTFSR